MQIIATEIFFNRCEVILVSNMQLIFYHNREEQIAKI